LVHSLLFCSGRCRLFDHPAHPAKHTQSHFPGRGDTTGENTTRFNVLVGDIGVAHRPTLLPFPLDNLDPADRTATAAATHRDTAPAEAMHAFENAVAGIAEKSLAGRKDRDRHRKAASDNTLFLLRFHPLLSRFIFSPFLDLK